jgi:hypothetical protein
MKAHSLILLAILLSIFSVNSVTFGNPCMGSMCQQEVENCSNQAVCMTTLATCHQACHQPYDYACFSFCGAPFNSGEYKSMISCAQKNGCAVDPLKQIESKV